MDKGFIKMILPPCDMGESENAIQKVVAYALNSSVEMKYLPDGYDEAAVESARSLLGMPDFDADEIVEAIIRYRYGMAFFCGRANSITHPTEEGLEN